MQSQGFLDQLRGQLHDNLNGATAGHLPLYQRVQSVLREAIQVGSFARGGGLPPERELAGALGISRVTVRTAVKGLVDEGLLESRQGAGTFVRPHIDMPLKALTSFTEDMRERGLRATSKLLDAHEGLATPQEREMLSLTDGDLVTRLYRLRSAEGKPLSIELAVLARDILAPDEDFGVSLYEYLAKRDLRPVRAIQRLRAELIEIEYARLLEVMPGAAGLYVERQTFAQSGRPIEFVRSRFRGDAYDFVAELRL